MWWRRRQQQQQHRATHCQAIPCFDADPVNLIVEIKWEGRARGIVKVIQRKNKPKIFRTECSNSNKRLSFHGLFQPRKITILNENHTSIAVK